MSFTYAVNCSILHTELPLLERAAAAAAAGFTAVEYWWPFPVAVPADSQVDAFVSSVADAGVRLVGLNVFAGDMPGGERGVLSDPARSQEYRDSLDVATAIAGELGCKAFNALYGNTPAGADQDALDQVATENLLLTCKAVQPLGGTVLIEPLSGSPTYPLKTADDGAAVVDRLRSAGADNVALLFDAYHLAANGDDPFAAIDHHYDLFGHVQIADNPGRGEPGSGSLDIEGLLAALRSRGWTRYVALEYKPTVPSPESYRWLPPDRRGAERG